MKRLGKLLIISHTEHYLAADGTIVGWGPTIREINHLLNIFDEIWHIAVLHDSVAPKSSMAYVSDRIHFIPIKPFGGRRITAKLAIIFHIPSILAIVLRILKKVDFWQFRAPTGIGVFLVPFLSIFINKPGWFKYAGNWMQEHPPLGYRLQRFWLAKLQKRTVTINGHWPGLPVHCLSFENPCLDEHDCNEGYKALIQKNYKPPFEICFIGRLEPEKGIITLLEALDNPRLSNTFVKVLHIVGEGRSGSIVADLAKKLSFPIVIHGALSREEVGKVLQQCDFNILPSHSEGFPKVIAEGAAYGAIPVVTNISSIGHYIIHKENGFLLELDKIKSNTIVQDLEEVFLSPNLIDIARTALNMSSKFTFGNYNSKLKAILDLKDN
jgi:glycosyltransferase involved in cell wall biosynthesis